MKKQDFINECRFYRFKGQKALALNTLLSAQVLFSASAFCLRLWPFRRGDRERCCMRVGGVIIFAHSLCRLCCARAASSSLERSPLASDSVNETSPVNWQNIHVAGLSLANYVFLHVFIFSTTAQFSSPGTWGCSNSGRRRPFWKWKFSSSAYRNTQSPWTTTLNKRWSMLQNLFVYVPPLFNWQKSLSPEYF